MSTPPRFVVAVAVAVCHRERVLAVRRAPHRDAGAGLWEVPAGRLHLDEEPFDAAVRELAEETGLRLSLDPRPIDLLPARRGEAPMVIVLYRARLPSNAPPPRVRLGPEHDASAWWDSARMARSNMPPRLQRALRLALRDEAAKGAPSG